jgi:hypothetical protein
MIRKTLPQILKSLTPINRADDVYTVASAERMNALQDAISLLARGENIVSGVNTRKTSGEGYVVISGKPGGGGIGRGGISGFPFEISIEVIGGTYYVKVAPGTMNGALPTNIFDNFAIGAFGTFYVQLDCVTDGKSITDVSIDVLTFPPAPIPWLVNLAPDSFHYLLGVVVDLEPFNIVNTNLFSAPVAGVQTLTESPAPGRPYYDINWSWSVEGV